MKNEREPDKQFIQSKTPVEILDGLSDVVGNNLGFRIRDQILNNENLQRVVVTGTPNSGKTTIIEAVKQIAQEAGYKITIVSFDLLRSSFLANLGRKVEFLAELTMEEMNDYNQYLFKGLTELPEESQSGEKHLVIVETPGVGFVDRGQSALKYWGSKIHETRDGMKSRSVNNTLAIHLISDEQVNVYGKIVRTLAHKCKNDSSFKKRLFKLGINLGELKQDDKDSSVLINYYKQMANRNQIEAIRNEYDKQANDAFEIVNSEDSELAKLAQAAIMIPEGINLRSEEDEHRIKINALYGHYLYRREFRFPPDATIVAINRFAGGVNYASV